MTHEQIDAKKKIGCDVIEIQLLGELRQPSSNIFEIFSLKDFEKDKIKVIHAPILPGEGDVTLEELCNGKTYALLDKVCYIANYFGEIQQTLITIVVHLDSFLDYMKKMDGVLERTVTAMMNMLETYPHIRFGIENVTLIRDQHNTKHLYNNFAFDNVEFVQFFRTAMNTTRVGTVLDTCHAIISEKYMSAIYQILGVREDLSMERYFKENKDYCFLIHLADAKGSGYGFENHGIPFEDRNKLKKILELYYKYGYNINCPITIDIQEKDYTNCVRYEQTYKLVRELDKEIQGERLCTL